MASNAFFSTERPAGARGFIHKKAFGLVRRAFAPVVEAAVGFVPGSSAVREGLKLARRGFGADPRAPVIPQSLGVFPDRPESTTPVTLPPTPRITTPAERSMGVEFQPVTGAFGLPAMAPFAITQIHLDCPKGMVLGRDSLCYPKQVLRRNSSFRKWRSSPSPTVTRRDEVALQRIDSVQKALKRLGKKAGLKVTG